jgi:hypothetical protein
VLFAVALFVSAFLLFVLQPMIGKMLLPKLGGTPAVWNTCMVFFQALLLAGYCYAHLATTKLKPQRQILLQLFFLLLPLSTIPIVVSHANVPPSDGNPVLWLLGSLALSVGLPFLVLSTSAPLLQKWFALTRHVSAADPYYLYAASNLGSMTALLSYPLVIEPYLTLRADRWLSQSWLWSIGYGLFIVLTAACALAVWRSRKYVQPADLAPRVEDIESQQVIPIRQRLRWIALAFVPSSLMIGTTTYITVDIAAVPLLWIVPLSLYLLSFVIVFARWPKFMHASAVVAMPIAILLLVYSTETTSKPTIEWTIALELLALFLVSLVCHGELARSRPPTQFLTGFYLLLSLGGVLGGLFNGIVAPLVFRSVLEYPIAIVLACLLLPPLKPSEKIWSSKFFPRVNARLLGWTIDLLAALVIGIFTYSVLFAADRLKAIRSEATDAAGLEINGILIWLATHGSDGIKYAATHLSVEPTKIEALLLFGLPLLLASLMSGRPVRLGLAVAAFMLACGAWRWQSETPIVYQQRSFYGVLRVEHLPATEFQPESYSLLHGTTQHGQQFRDPRRRREALTYYHASGPVGDIFAAMTGRLEKRALAIIGLGTGTLASYGKTGQEFTFYDIDPAVKRIASNPEFFTYLSDSAAQVKIILGDARIRLEEAPDGEYGMIMVDAFSSDAIPIHLITKEAIELYFCKLNAHGVLAVHISNRYLNLEPVLGNLAENLELVARGRSDDKIDARTLPGKNRSQWIVLARRIGDLGRLASDWTSVERNRKVGVWTDDYSNLLRVFN